MKSSKKSNLSKNSLSRLIFFAFFLCGSSSCSNELQEITDNDVKTATVTLSVDEGNALKIKKTGSYETLESEAINMVRQTYMNEALTKTGRNFIIKSCKKTSLHGALTKSSENPGYYVIEFTDGVKNGFSLTSADRRLSEVFAYSEKGSLSDTTYNNGLKLFCQLLPGYIENKIKNFNTDSLYNSAISRLATTKSGWIDDGPIHYLYMLNGFIPDPDYEYMGEVVEFEYISEIYKFLTTQWGQGAPYNLKLPLVAGTPNGHAYVGCQILAALQIMAYHKKPYNNVSTNDWTRFTQFANCYEVKLQDCIKAAFDAYDKGDVDASGTEASITDTKNFLQKIGYSVGSVSDYRSGDLRPAIPTIARGENSKGEGMV